MPKPRTYQTEAVIIKKVKLGEADRILTLYTPHLGKIQGVAKGVRRPRSKLAGHLELLTHSQVSLARGRNLDTIIGSQTIDIEEGKSLSWLNFKKGNTKGNILSEDLCFAFPSAHNRLD